MNEKIVLLKSTCFIDKSYISFTLFIFLFFFHTPIKEKKSAPEPSAGDKESVIALLVEARFMRGARNEPKRKENKA